MSVAEVGAMTDAPTTTLLTADDLANMPDDGWHYELDRGRLIRMTAASTRPASVTMNVALDMGASVRLLARAARPGGRDTLPVEPTR